MIAPDESRLPGSDTLIGVDDNAYAIMAVVNRELRRAGADAEWAQGVIEDMSSDGYDHLLAVAIDALDGRWKA